MKKVIIIVLAVIGLGFNFIYAVDLNVENAKVIYLLGEYHAGSAGDNMEDTQSRKLVEHLAAERKVAYVKEGIVRGIQEEKEFRESLKNKYGVPNINVYGVEDPLVFIFNSALLINFDYRSQLKSQNGAVFPLTGKMLDLLCSLMYQGNQSFLDDFWHSEALIGNPIFEYLKDNKDYLLNAKSEVKEAIFRERVWEWDSSFHWMDLGKEVALRVAPLYADMLPESKRDLLRFVLSCLEDFELGSDCDYRAEPYVLMKALHLTLRDDFIINNLEQVYSIAEGKPVVSILGKWHIDNVKAELGKRGFVVLGKDEFMDKMRKDEL